MVVLVASMKSKLPEEPRLALSCFSLAPADDPAAAALEALTKSNNFNGRHTAIFPVDMLKRKILEQRLPFVEEASVWRVVEALHTRFLPRNNRC